MRIPIHFLVAVYALVLGGCAYDSEIKQLKRFEDDLVKLTAGETSISQPTYDAYVTQHAGALVDTASSSLDKAEQRYRAKTGLKLKGYALSSHAAGYLSGFEAVAAVQNWLKGAKIEPPTSNAYIIGVAKRAAEVCEKDDAAKYKGDLCLEAQVYGDEAKLRQFAGDLSKLEDELSRESVETVSSLLTGMAKTMDDIRPRLASVDIDANREAALLRLRTPVCNAQLTIPPLLGGKGEAAHARAQALEGPADGFYVAAAALMSPPITDGVKRVCASSDGKPSEQQAICEKKQAIEYSCSGWRRTTPTIAADAS
ncbi:MAG: hypothetical protein AAF719_05575 [Pseudomonadota bacterium]